MNKKNIIFLGILFFLIYPAIVPVQKEDTNNRPVKKRQTVKGNDRSLSIAVINGDVYIAGYFSGVADLDPTDGITTYTSIGETDIYLTKVNKNRTYAWTKTIGSIGNDSGEGVAVMRKAVYITGFLSGAADFNGDGNPDITPKGARDAFVAKYSLQGDFLWVKRFGGNGGTVTSMDILVDRRDNVFIGGFFTGRTVDFNPDSEEDLRSSQGGKDIFFSKINPDGSYGWTNTIGGPSSEQVNSLTVSPRGNIFITGSFDQTVDFDPGNKIANLTAWGALNKNAFVAKYTQEGSYMKATAFGRTKNPSNIGYSEGMEIVTDGWEDVYVTGYFGSRLPAVALDFLDPSNPKTSQGDDDIFVAKIDSGFARGLWTVTIGGTGKDKGLGLFIDSWDLINVTGFYTDTKDIDLDGDGYTEPRGGLRDIFLTLLDSSNGSFVWTHKSSRTGKPLRVMTMGGIGNDEGKDLFVDIDGTIYVTGYFQGKANFDPERSFAGYKNAQGGDSAFLIRFSGSKAKSVTITPSVQHIKAGFSKQFHAFATFEDGTTGEVTYSVRWFSDAPSVAMVGITGWVTGKSGGRANIFASLDNVSGPPWLLIVEPVASIKISPSSPSVREKENIQFNAQATYSDGSTADVTNLAVWVSSNPAIASIRRSYGNATGINEGTTIITAVLAGITSSPVTLTVKRSNTLQNLTVSSEGWPVIFSGKTMQFFAVGTYQDGSFKDISSSVTWSSGNPAVAKIGPEGIASAGIIGTADITATAGDITAVPVTLKVTKVIESIAILSKTTSLIKGDTLQFTANALYADKTTDDITLLVQWTSSNTSVLNINSFGSASAADTGTSVITASVNGILSNSVSIKVNHR